MTIGAGKYDDICTHARMRANALAAIVIILSGSKGSGFSVQAVEGAHAKVISGLPELLRELARQIEGDTASRAGPAQ